MQTVPLSHIVSFGNFCFDFQVLRGALLPFILIS